MKRPAYQHYVGDWHSDTQLQRCSLAARGLWTEMLGLMHMGIPYGYLTVQMKDTVEGYPLPDLAAWIGRSLDEVAQAFAELDAKGVFSRDPITGHVFSRRMVRDEDIRRKRAEGGKKSLDHPNVPKRRTTSNDVLSVEDEEEVEVGSKEESQNSATKAAPHFDLEAYWQRLVKIYNKAEKSAFTQQTYVLIVDGDEAVARLIESRAALYVQAKGNFTVGLNKFLNERIFEQNPEVWSNGNGNGKASREARTRAIAEQVAFESDDSTEESIQRHH
jgi:hypothetical protein